eukprot:COSAG06_NODE_5790_length_3273_cov_45.704066_3_plen_105_part_00
MAHNPFGQSEHGGSGLRLDDVGFSPHLGNVIVHTGPYALLGAVRNNTRIRLELVWSSLVWSGLVWSGLVWSGLWLTCGNDAAFPYACACACARWDCSAGSSDRP